MSDAGAAKAQAGKHGGGFQAPPPDKPRNWTPLGVLQYHDVDGVFEYRVMGNIPQAIREDLHEKHGIGFAAYGEVK